jgi:DNA-binding MurR/RpiR family transcriptional regulator
MTSYESRIHAARAGFSPSFSRLADFVLDNYTQAAFLTATELAHRLDVDPGTVVRFSQHIGYRGYPEFQREIREKVQHELLIVKKADPGTSAEAAEQAIQEVTHCLELTRRSFPVEIALSLIAALDEAERVILLSDGMGFPPARSLGSLLESVGYTVHFAGSNPSDLARAIAGLGKDDLVLAVEVRAETPFIAQAMAQAKESGARTAALLVTRSSQIARYSDWVLTSHINPQPGIGQIVLESMIFALTQMLIHARPGRFEKTHEQVQSLTQNMMRREIK